jgi:hypothetical protein
MAIINDPDDLNQGVEIDIDTDNLEITLNPGSGNLTNDGVTLQAVFSFLKEEWNSDPALIAYDFPIAGPGAVGEQFIFIDDWVPSNEQTRTLFRSAGWREITSGGAIKREYLCPISLDSGAATIDPGDTAYYAFASDSAKTNFDFDGPVNQGIQSFGDTNNGNFDKRSEELKLFIRTQGKIYSQASTTAIGVSGITFIGYRFPLSESNDLKGGTSDNDIDTLQPYLGMSITYGSVDRVIGGVTYTYDTALINGNNGTKEQIYEFVQRQLRKSTDIDANTSGVIGELADGLLTFVGDTLVTAQGVYIDAFNPDDTNSITFTDGSGTPVTFPFVASGQFNFNAVLQADGDAVFRLFFADSYGTSSAITVEDNNGNPIAGDISGNASLGFTFDYDGNVQGGRTPATDAPVVAVAIGQDGAQYVRAEGTITRASGQTLAFVAAQERNFINPA